MNKLYRIVLSYAVFGIEVSNNTVVFSAPIGRWMIGKRIEFIRRWVNKKGGSIGVYYES